MPDRSIQPECRSFISQLLTLWGLAWRERVLDSGGWVIER